MSLYPVLKSAHLLFVMAWVAAVFYLPRLMINFAESPGQTDVQARLLLMARRLYKFGHVMFALALPASARGCTPNCCWSPSCSRITSGATSACRKRRAGRRCRVRSRCG